METMLAQTPLRFFDARFDAAPIFAERIGNPGLLVHVMGTLAPKWDVTLEPASLRVPIFIAHGRYDYTVPSALWDGAIATLPNATLEVFDRSGHHPFFEEPERFAATLMDWMGRH
jgi:proline iminopeptidase